MKPSDFLLTPDGKRRSKPAIAVELVKQTDITHPRQIDEALDRISAHTLKEIDYALSYLDKGVEPAFITRILAGILFNSKK